MTTEEFQKHINNKFVIFDSGVLTRGCDHYSKFEEIITIIKNANCSIASFPLIDFEFIRGAHTIIHKQKREEFLKLLAVEHLPIKDDHVKEAIKIAQLYTKNKIESPSVVDCCIAGLLKTFKDNLFLCTLNHKDFPLIIFDRFYIHTIDTDREVFPLAFYSFNSSKGGKLGL